MCQILGWDIMIDMVIATLKVLMVQRWVSDVC